MRARIVAIIPLVAFGLSVATQAPTPHAAAAVVGPGGASLTVNIMSDATRHVAIGAYSEVPKLNNTAGSPEPCLPGWCGHVGSCMGLTTGDLGITSMCRVVNGFNAGQYAPEKDVGGALFDHTNWDVKIILGHPKAVYHDVGYGYSISTYSNPPCQGTGCAPGGGANMFEGCQKIASWDGKPLHSAATAMDHYYCEFSTFNDVLTKPHTHTTQLDQFLTSVWPFTRDRALDPAACAFSVMGWTSGIPVALRALGLNDCRAELHP